MLTQLRSLFGRGHDRGFTLIELLIVVLIVGILAAVAAPIYFGYVRDAKTAEGKAVAGSLWSAIQANGIGACGVATSVSQGYPKAGLDTTGATVPLRWKDTSGGAGTLSVACDTGAYTASASPLFVITGEVTDVTNLRIGLFYDAATTPPATLRCTTTGSDPDTTSPAC